jgi:hypothetical protein
MVEPSANEIAPARHVRAVRPGRRAADPDRCFALGPARSEAAIWADELMTLIRGEMRVAVRRGVISTGESEQLLARLNLVVDQALTTR